MNFASRTARRNANPAFEKAETRLRRIIYYSMLFLIPALSFSLSRLRISPISQHSAAAA